MNRTIPTIVVPLAVAAAAAAFSYLSLRVVGGYGLLGGVVALVVIAVALLMATVVPVHALPAVAITCYVLIPQQAVGYLSGVSVGTAVLVVWMARRVLQTSPRSGSPRETGGWVLVARAAAGALLMWVVFLYLTTPAQAAGVPARDWVVSFAFSVVAVIFVGDNRQEVRVLLALLPWLTGIIAFAMVIEYLMAANVVYGAIYSAVGRPAEGVWTSYRAHGSFGHPLYASTFLAVSVAAAFSRWLDRVRGAQIWLLMAGAALLLTLSRGGIAAAAAAVALSLAVGFAWPGAARATQYVRAVALIVAVAAAAIGSGVLQGRVGSEEAAGSTQVRSQIIPMVIELAGDYGWLGSGPASSDQLMLQLSDGSFPLENSYLQLLVSLGAPGLLLFILMLVALTGHALQTRNRLGLAMLCAYCVAVVGYNAIETLLPQHVLLGLIALVCIGPAPRARAADVSRSSEAKAWS